MGNAFVAVSPSWPGDRSGHVESLWVICGKLKALQGAVPPGTITSIPIFTTTTTTQCSPNHTEPCGTMAIVGQSCPGTPLQLGTPRHFFLEGRATSQVYFGE